MTDDNDIGYLEDDELIDMLSSDPGTAMVIVWTAAAQLVTQVEHDFEDIKKAEDGLKNIYLITKAFDMLMQQVVDSMPDTDESKANMLEKMAELRDGALDGPAAYQKKGELH